MVPANFYTANGHERFVDVIASFITNAKTAILMQPRETAFYHPAVDTQSAAIFGPAFSKKGDNSSLTKFSSMRFTVITPVSQHTIRTLNRSSNLACYCRDAVNQRQQLCDIVAVCASQYHRKRNTIGVRYQMVFRTFLAAIRGIGACFRPPKTARNEAESTTAREKSIWSARRNLLNSTCPPCGEVSPSSECILSHTPAFCHSCSRRQQVIPQPQFISWGKSSHPMPVFNTNIIPVNAARSDMGLRPGYRGLRFFFGISGSMISHNWSSSIGFAMSGLLAFARNIQLLMLSAIDVKNISFC